MLRIRTDNTAHPLANHKAAFGADLFAGSADFHVAGGAGVGTAASVCGTAAAPAGNR